MSNLIIESELFGTVGIVPYPVQAGASEALEYNTDIITSYTALLEERNQMRARPRQSFQYTYETGYGNMQAVYNALYSNIRGKWLVPLWFELQAFAASAGQTSIPVDTTVHDIRANSYVLIYQSVYSWQVVKVTAIATSLVTCDALTIDGAAYIVPLRVGFHSGQVNASPTGQANSFKTNFVVDVDVLTGLTDSAPQLNGLDFYTTPYLIEQKGDVQILWDEDQVQFDTGNVDHSTSWTRARYSKGYVWDDNGQAALRALKQYFYRRAGRFRSFLSPTFETNLRSASVGNVGTAFKFYDEGYTDNLFATRKLLGFQLTDGTWLTRTATASAHLGSGIDQVTLNAALNVNANDIARVSFIAENRLDTDKLDITLYTSDRFRASASVMEISA